MYFPCSASFLNRVNLLKYGLSRLRIRRLGVRIPPPAPLGLIRVIVDVCVRLSVDTTSRVIVRPGENSFQWLFLRDAKEQPHPSAERVE